MNRPVKIFLWLIAAIAAVFAIAAIAFLFLFDPNNFKEDVERAVEESTGRELDIAGDVSVKIFPWLAVEIGEARLGNAPGFGEEPFAAFESVTLSVQLMPLIFQREVVVGTAEIDGLQLHLAVRDDGTDNWSDLSAGGDGEVVIGDEEGRGHEPGKTSGKLAVSGVAIRNATITYASGADQYSLTEAEFTIGPVYGDEKALVVGDIALRALVSGATEIPTRFEFETGGIDVDAEGQVASVQPIEMSVLGIDLSATFEPIDYSGDLDATAALRIDTFSPRSVMTQLGIEPPATVDPNALSKVSIDATAAVGASSARLTGVTVKVDDTTLTGAMTVPFDPAGRFFLKLAGDSIDLNRYMTVDGEAASTGEAAPPMEVPADLIKPLNAHGDLEFGSVRVANLELTGVTVGLDAADGRMRIHPIAAGLFGGSYSGDVRIDASGKTPSLSVNESVQGVDLAKLAMAMFEQQNITGTIAGNFKLGGRGNDLGEIRETLSGTMSLELKDGTYEGTDIWYELRRARAMLKQEEPPQPQLPARTPFSSVTATGVVTDGVMRNEDLKAELPFMELTGAGNVDLAKGTVDYGLRARIFSKPELMGDATAEEISDLTKANIPLRISGSLASPKVVPDVEALVRGRVEEELKEKEEEVKEKLEEKLKDIFKR